MSRKTVFITTVLLFVSAAPAHAATARVVADCDKLGCLDRVVFVAASGERNVLTTEVVAGGARVVRDAGAPITPGNACIAIDGGVSCSPVSHPGYAPGLIAHLGDERDSATVTTSDDSAVYGGSGDDRITGASTQSGGPGDDVLTDAVTFIDDDGARPGHDTYRGRSAARLVVRLSYASRKRGVRADLRPGARSEDEISGVRSIIGGRGDDVLIGDDADNALDGGSGRDRLDGRGGDDSLWSGGGARERLFGGSGDDALWGGGSELYCGPGEDTVQQPFGDVVNGDCERVDAGNEARLRTVLPTTNASVLSDISPCVTCEDRSDRWSVRRGGRAIGTVVTGADVVSLRLDRAGRRLLRAQHRLTVTIELRRRVTSDAKVYVRRFTTTLRLR